VETQPADAGWVAFLCHVSPLPRAPSHHFV